MNLLVLCTNIKNIVMSSAIALTINVKEMFEKADTSAIEEGGAFYQPYQMVNTLGGGGWTILQTVMLYVFAFCFSAGFIGLAWHRKHPQESSAEKSGLGAVAVATIGGTAVIGIMAFLQSIGISLFSFGG